MNNHEHIPGAVTVSLRAAAQVAEYIVKSQKGVSALASKRGIQKPLRGSRSSRGVRFTNTERGFNIDISIYTVYGVNVNKLCSDISVMIRSELEGNMGIPINKIQVFVEGIRD